MRSLAFLPALLACACGPGAGGAAGADGGLGTDRPHVLVIAASGHRLVPSSGPHEEYLVQQGTVGRLVEALGAGGELVWAWDHADEFFSHDAAGNALTPWDNADFVSFGFLHLLEDLGWVDENWVQGREQPTRIVVLAHSHGVVWAHIAMHLLPDVPVETLIDLDGDCTAWDGESLVGLPADGWDQVILDWSEANQVQWDFDIWRVRDAWTVPGVAEPQDTEDVVPASAVRVLAVRGSGPLLRDADLEYRLDGSAEGISAFVSPEGHEEVAEPDSEAMDWVIESIGTE